MTYSCDLPYNPGMPNRQPRDFAALEHRRKQAARLFAKGETVLASVARQLKVTRQSAFRWYQQWRSGGSGALKAAGRAGRKPRLNMNQLRKVETALMKGARYHGFAADLWTLPRVANVVERVTGVKYHLGTCGRFWDPCIGPCRSLSAKPRSATMPRFNTGRRCGGRK